MLDWNDVKIFVAAVRAGSLGAASESLRIDPATVGRRVTRLESALKATLVIRSPTGLQLTATGIQLYRIGLEAEATMQAAAEITPTNVAAGTVRVSAGEGFGAVIMAPEIPDFLKTKRGLRVELAVQAGFLSPSRREVDMAITFQAAESQRLIIEPLAEYQAALFAAPSYLNRTSRPAAIDDLIGRPLVGYIDDLVFAPEVQYFNEISPNLKITTPSTSLHVQRAILAAGGGIGVLPCYMAGGLERVLADQVLLRRRFVLSTYKDVYDSAPVRTVRHWLKDLATRKQSILSPYGDDPLIGSQG